MADGRERLGNSTAAFLAYTRTLRNKQKADSLNSIPPSKSLNSPPHTTNRMDVKPENVLLGFHSEVKLIDLEYSVHTESRS